MRRINNKLRSLKDGHDNESHFDSSTNAGSSQEHIKNQRNQRMYPGQNQQQYYNKPAGPPRPGQYEEHYYGEDSMSQHSFNSSMNFAKL